ncbi:MAG: penicillin-binding transpeptidase domain-containing protein, partial [Planctomycetota bacterium]
RLAPGERIECTGHLLEHNPNAYRCWIFKQFGATHQGEHGVGLAASEAIKVSCNIFFYELGRRLGADGLREAYRWFGLGETFDLGVGPEFAGWIGDARTNRLERPDQIFLGIGQGPIAWTPLHAAEAIATLARAGVRLRPTLIRGGSTGDAVELDIPRDAINDALEGLRLSVNDPDGTGHHITMPDGSRENIFNVQGVDLWGKTGTAESVDLAIDTNGDGEREIVRAGDHSWFVLLVAPVGQRPRYAVAVVMEYAGSGGRVSGPIANQIVHALQNEGYLDAGAPN